MLGNAPADLADRGFLASCRVRICLQGHQPFGAATAAVYDTLKAQREGTSLPKLASPELLNQLTRREDYVRWGKNFLSEA